MQMKVQRKKEDVLTVSDGEIMDIIAKRNEEDEITVSDSEIMDYFGNNSDVFTFPPKLHRIINIENNIVSNMISNPSNSIFSDEEMLQRYGWNRHSSIKRFNLK